MKDEENSIVSNKKNIEIIDKLTIRSPKHSARNFSSSAYTTPTSDKSKNLLRP